MAQGRTREASASRRRWEARGETERAGLAVRPEGYHRVRHAERAHEQKRAMEHLDRAGELFSHYGAKLYLDQVHAKKQSLKA